MGCDVSVGDGVVEVGLGARCEVGTTLASNASSDEHEHEVIKIMMHTKIALFMSLHKFNDKYITP